MQLKSVLLLSLIITVSSFANSMVLPTKPSEIPKSIRLFVSSSDSSGTRSRVRRRVSGSEERAGVSAVSFEKVHDVLGLSTVSTERFHSWFTTGKSMDYIFTHLNLHPADNEVFSNPRFVAWVTYMDDFTAKNANAPMAIISALVNHFGDKRLIEMLNEAKRVPSTKNIAVQLEMKQMHRWILLAKTPQDVFTLLKLNTVGYTVLTHPLFKFWIRYVKMFQKENPEMIVNWSVELRRFYPVRQQLVNQAGMKPSTLQIVKMLQTDDLKYHLNIGSSPKSVYHSLILAKERSEQFLPQIKRVPGGYVDLKIEKMPINLLTSEDFKIWVKYVNDFNRLYPYKKTNTVQLLLDHYTDQAVVQMLVNAKKNPKTEVYAENLQNLLLNTWARELKPPTKVSKYLVNLEQSDELMTTYKKKYKRARGSSGEKLFDRYDFKNWMKYLNFFKEKHPTSTVSDAAILTFRFGDEAVTRMISDLSKLSNKMGIGQKLQSEQLYGWLTSRKSPDDVFKILTLNEAGDKLFAGPLYDIWLMYIRIFNNRYPTEKLTSIEVLRKHYSDEGISRIIIVAKKVGETRTRATLVQERLFESWLKAKTNPDQVYKWFNVAVADKDEPRLYQKYLRKLNQRNHGR